MTKTNKLWATAWLVMFSACAIAIMTSSDNWFVKWCVEEKHGQYGKDENGVGTCYEYAKVD